MDKSNISAPLRILLAIDGSSHAQAAVSLLTHIAWPVETSTRVLAVTPEFLSVGSSGLGGRYRPDSRATNIYEWDRSASQILASQVTARLQTRRLKAEAEVYAGQPTSVILTRAEELLADLIVVGAKGHHAPNDVCLGSTAERLADDPHRSVLIARPNEHIRPLRTILVVNDLAAARRAIQFLCGLSPSNWARVTVVSLALEPAILSVAAGSHIVPNYEPHLIGLASPLLAETYALEAVHRLHECSAQGEIVLRSGPPADEILAVAQAKKANLIVIGSSIEPQAELSGWNEVVRQVVRDAPSSVMVVR